MEFVGPQVGRDLQLQAIYAVLFGLVGILLYIAWAFKSLKGGVAAIAAVFHDMVFCLGALSITGREFSLPVLAALLTIIGYSVNDTIVAYDRLRENRSKFSNKGKSFAEQMNDAVNQTLSRTVLTALTVFLSTAILLVLRGQDARGLRLRALPGRHHGHLLHDLHRRRDHRGLDPGDREPGGAPEKSGGESLNPA